MYNETGPPRITYSHLEYEYVTSDLVQNVTTTRTAAAETDIKGEPEVDTETDRKGEPEVDNVVVENTQRKQVGGQLIVQNCSTQANTELIGNLPRHPIFNR